MSEEERVGTQEIGLQFSLYPLRQAHLRPAIEAAAQPVAKEGVAVTVARLSTFAAGDEDAVFGAINTPAEVEAARRRPTRSTWHMTADDVRLWIVPQAPTYRRPRRCRHATAQSTRRTYSPLAPPPDCSMPPST